MKNKFMDSDRNIQIYKMYTTTNKSAREVGDQFGLCESTIRRIVTQIRKKINYDDKKETAKRISKKDQKINEFVDELLKNHETPSIQSQPISQSNDNSSVGSLSRNNSKSSIRSEILKFRDELRKY